MAALGSGDGGHGSGRGVRGRSAGVRCGLLALAAASALTLATGSAGAVPTAPKDPEAELAKLEKQADKLSKEYRGELIALEEAKNAAKKAARDAEQLSKEWDSSRVAVQNLAASTYMTGELGTAAMFGSVDPAAMLRDAATLEHLNTEKARRVQRLEQLAAQADRSRKTAETKVAEVREQIEDLESQRERVKKLLAKYQPESPSSGGGSGRPDNVTGTKSPIVGNSMTSRMRNVLVAVDGRFGPFPTIGCFRGGAGAQDHGTGTACDFMESTGGNMPSASARAHGDSVAQYAIDNASSLGVKYVIWRQRIWDARSGGGWRVMEDRGSVTANHYDHIHISVL